MKAYSKKERKEGKQLKLKGGILGALNSSMLSS